MKEKISAMAIVGLLSALAFAGCISLPGNDAEMGEYTGDLKSFDSYGSISDFLKRGAETTNSNVGRNTAGGPIFVDGGKGISAIGASMETSSLSDYSQTNIQVEGVDEADIVKTDGNYIYAVCNKWTDSGAENKVVIIDAYSLQIISTVYAESEISGIYASGNRLAIIESGYSYGLPYIEKYAWWGGYGASSTGLRVYDISNALKPFEIYNYSISGNYFSSRMIGDWVYLVSNEYAYCYDESYENVTIPVVCRNGEEQKMPAEEIYYIDCPETSYNYNNILALNVNDGRSSEKSFMMGSASEMFVSLENMYITSTNSWRFVWFGWGGYGLQNTTINKFSINDGEITHVAKGEVPGYINDQFSMDESNGYFRIATTKGDNWNSETANNLYVLDQGMNVVGSVEGLAEGETIKSVRFMGERAYVVTFKQVDPLFVIDIKDPSAPKVVGQLKIPGWSEYLHPYDENHVIGIGKDADETIDADKVHTDGAIYYTAVLGIKISLFDVSDVEHPIEIAKTVIGERGSDSEALWDHHAFLFSKEKSLLVIPATICKLETANGSEWSYDRSVTTFEGAIAFRLTLDGGFQEIGRITHQTASPSGSDYWYPDYDLQVRRSLYIGDVLYTISNGMVKSSDLANGLAEIGSLKL